MKTLLLATLLFTEIKDFALAELEALKHGAQDAVYNSQTTDAFRASTSKQEFRILLDTYPELNEFSDVGFGEISKEEGSYHVPIRLETAKGTSKAEMWVKRREENWKIDGLNVIHSAYYIPLEEEVFQTISLSTQEVLENLQRGNIEDAYWQFTSDDFKNATTFVDFQKTLNTYPILTKWNKIVFKNGTKERHLSRLRTTISSNEEAVDVDWRFAKDGSEAWKVWGVQVLTETFRHYHKKDEISVYINELIKTLSKKQFLIAYETLTSAKFQSVTDALTFKKFIQHRPELTDNNNIEVKEIVFEDSNASAIAFFTSQSGVRQGYKFRFINEQGRWKLYGMQIIFQK